LTTTAIATALRRLAHGEALSAVEARAAFDVVMRGEASVAQTAGLLLGLRVKGETPDEVAGAAGALRAAMVLVRADRPDELVDTCGTGGGAVPTFNISTASALLAAGAGRAGRQARQPVLHLALGERGRAGGARGSDRRAGGDARARAPRRGDRLHVRAGDAPGDAPRRPGSP
jgi:hypothetical protein